MRVRLPFFRKRYCLVLGGGGTKGIYELGVWTALRELGVYIEAVIGTSIGAINGMWIAQEDYEKARSTWETITLGDVLRIPDNFLPPASESNDLKALEILWRILRRQGKLDNSPLRSLVLNNIRPDRLVKGKVDFGIITFNASRMIPDVVFAKETEADTLVDYIMASATIPGFTPTTIGRSVYLDGGLYDNVPVEAARTRGYRRLIVVDVGGLGVRRSFDPWGLDAVFIRNSESLGHILEFRPEFLRRYRMLGYLDTMKAFSRLEGDLYFLRRDARWYHAWDAMLRSPDFAFQLPENISPWKACLPYAFRFHKNPVRFLLESAAEALDLERLEVYTPRDLTGLVMKRYLGILESVESLPLPERQGFLGALECEWKQPRILPGLGKKAPLEADLILTRLGFHRSHPWVMDILHSHWPKLRAAKIFLHLAARWSRLRLPASRSLE